MRDLSQKEEFEWKQYYPRIPLNVDPILDDSTLRDGVQMPGIAISPENTAHIAYLLDQLGIERIEVHHFQKQDQEAIRLIKDKGLRTRVAGWCRAVRADIDNVLALDLKEVGISHPVSHIHLAAKWPDKSDDELLRRVADVVEYAAKDHGLTVFVHGEDSTRADWAFERKFIDAVADAGAEVYRICDTVGVGVSDPNMPLPTGLPAKIQRIRDETRIRYVEMHAHDDLGNAVENSMAAIRATSDLYDKIYVSTTFLGMGERAGNAETEKVMMNLFVHHGIDKYAPYLSMLKEVADFIGHATGLTIPPNKAIVGDYAFAHESGIHTHGMLSSPLTYEPYPPALVGNKRLFTIGKQSGKAIIRHRMEEILGTKISEEDLRLQTVADKIKEIFEKGRRGSLKEGEFKEIVQEAYASQALREKEAPVVLDDVDLRLIRKLQRDGRTTSSELSEALRVPVSEVKGRLARLVDNKVIHHFIPVLNPIKLGLSVSALILIKARGENLSSMEQKLAEFSEVNVVYDITGEYDAAIVARFRTADELNRFLKKVLAVEDVERTATSVVLNILKEDLRLNI